MIAQAGIAASFSAALVDFTDSSSPQPRLHMHFVCVLNEPWPELLTFDLQVVKGLVLWFAT